MQHDAKPFVALGRRRHVERRSCAPDAFFRAKRERQLRGRRQRRVAAEKEEGEGVVVGRSFARNRQLERRGGLLAPAPSGLAALLVGLAFRRTRKASALALVLPALGDWVPNRGVLDPLRFAALHVADDAAYGAGVWAGCARERIVAPLRPRISWGARTWSARTLREGLER